MRQAPSEQPSAEILAIMNYIFGPKAVATWLETLSHSNIPG